MKFFYWSRMSPSEIINRSWNAIILFLGLSLFSCNVQSPETELVLQISNPIHFDSIISAAQVTLTISGTAYLLLDTNQKNLKGPWKCIPNTDLSEDQPITLNIIGYAKGVPKNVEKVRVNINYKVQKNRLNAEPLATFYQDTLRVNLKDSLAIMQWLILSADTVPNFTSLNPQIVTVLPTRNLKLLTAGTARIELRAGPADPSAAPSPDTLIIVVLPDKNEIPVNPVGVDSLRFTRDSTSLVLGLDDFPIIWNVYPKKYEDSVICESSNPLVVTMKNGYSLVPKSLGKTQIICSVPHSKVSDTLQVWVKEKSNPTASLDSIRLDLETLKLFMENPGSYLTYRVYPVGAQIEILWTVTPPIANISETGLIEPLQTGDGWVKIFGVGSGIVKDSLYLSVLDTTPKLAKWKKDTLTIQLAEGQSQSFKLSDSINNPSSRTLEFLQPTSDSKFVLTNEIISYSAGANDSGIHLQSITMRQGNQLTPVVIRANVKPTYLTLKLPATNGTITAIPTKDYYRYGERVTLTPNPSKDFIFSNWAGDSSGTSPTLEIEMKDNKTITAQFISGSVAACSIISNSSSINVALVSAYRSSSSLVTLCPESSGLYDRRTIGIIGKVMFVITK